MITIELPQALGIQVNGKTAVKLDAGSITVRDALDASDNDLPPLSVN